jgi:adenylate cyclase
MESEGLDALLGGWLASCKELIEHHHGMINKYLGDGFLAYWPEAMTTPEEFAALIAALKQVQQKNAPDFRIVAHFGFVAIGGIASMGEESLMGKEVNLIFRVEKIAGTLGEPRVITDAARAKLEALVPARPLGEHELKGFERKRALFAV